MSNETLCHFRTSQVIHNECLSSCFKLCSNFMDLSLSLHSFLKTLMFVCVRSLIFNTFLATIKVPFTSIYTFTIELIYLNPVTTRFVFFVAISLLGYKMRDRERNVQHVVLRTYWETSNVVHGQI